MCITKVSDLRGAAPALGVADYPVWGSHTQPKCVASVNVERIARELDVDTLQKLLGNIAFCDIDSEDLGEADQHIVKLFKSVVCARCYHHHRHLFSKCLRPPP
jgi:hypothetical protein